MRTNARALASSLNREIIDDRGDRLTIYTHRIHLTQENLPYKPVASTAAASSPAAIRSRSLYDEPDRSQRDPYWKNDRAHYQRTVACLAEWDGNGSGQRTRYVSFAAFSGDCMDPWRGYPTREQAKESLKR